MGALELGQVLLVGHLGGLALGGAARLDGLQIVLGEMCLEVALGVGDQLIDLGLVLALDGLGLLHLGLVAGDELVLLGLGEHLVATGGVDARLQVHDLGGAV